eukprot:8095392-Heterocapsa_arctica.AAC.1
MPAAAACCCLGGDVDLGKAACEFRIIVSIALHRHEPLHEALEALDVDLSVGRIPPRDEGLEHQLPGVLAADPHTIHE